MEQELAEIGDGDGLAYGDTVLGEGGEDLSENVVDVGGGEEVAAEGDGELGAKLLGFEELAARRERERGRARGGPCGGACGSGVRRRRGIGRNRDWRNRSVL